MRHRRGSRWRAAVLGAAGLLTAGCPSQPDRSSAPLPRSSSPAPRGADEERPADQSSPEPWSDAWLVAQAPRYLDDPAFRRAALEASLTEADNIYASTRLESYGRVHGGWDALPVWNPRVEPVTADGVAALRNEQPVVLSSAASTLWDGVRPDDYEGWVRLGRAVFYDYPLRPEIFAEHALRHPSLAARVGLQPAADGSWPGVVAFADVDGQAKIGITCALCHVALESGAVVEGRARRDLDYGRMRLAYHDDSNTPLPPELARRMAAWGPGRADITQDDAEDPVAIVDLWRVRDRRYLTQAATLTHHHPAALAIRQETQILHANLERTRPPRELAWALAMFVYSLQPPERAPSPLDARQRRGRGLFEHHCRRCHRDASGAGTPIDAAEIGTNPTLAFGRGRGTGQYRPAPLARVADAAPYLHDGTVPSLEALLGEARLAPDYVGARGRGAVPGHRYGISLPADERGALLAYLRTL